MEKEIFYVWKQGKKVKKIKAESILHALDSYCSRELGFLDHDDYVDQMNLEESDVMIVTSIKEVNYYNSI